MLGKIGKFTAIMFLLAIAAAACSFGPPPSCGDTVGGTADTVMFDQYFNSMTLVNQYTGLPGPNGDSGEEYASTDTLVIQVENTTEVTVRVCIQPRGPGSIALDQTQTFSAGSNTFDLGSFDKGSWVVRVIVDDTLVRNFPFLVK